MGEKLIVGPVNKGLKTDREPFVIDNDSFPVLQNAYQWRGRVKRKRGTVFLTRLQRFFNSESTAYSSNATATMLNDGSGNGIVKLKSAYNGGLETNAAIVPGSVLITDTSNGDETYTDPTLNGVLVGSAGGTGTINYASTLVNITGAAGHNVASQFIYYPDLPVMGLEDFYGKSSQFPGLIGFDTTYSYNITTTIPTTTYDVSFYKNPAMSSALPGYVPKSVPTSVTWNGFDYQQFYTQNYQGAMWTTNGIDVPFTGSTIGMQFAPASSITYISNTATTLTLVITNCPLVIGDFVFINEFSGSTSAATTSINFQSGYVTAASPDTTPYATKTITITFPDATISAGPYTPGIVQYLTNRSNPDVDCIRWYDGDPTDGDATDPTLDGFNGWVNFMPPLSHLSFSIADQLPAQYYLVGARIIFPFKDRLLFFGPVIQSSTGSPIYLKDIVIYSQNGTPYYTASFTGDPTFATTEFFPILVPTNQTAAANAYFEDVTGFGGFLSSALDQDINTVGPNEDVLIVGFNRVQAQLIYTGNDIIPFNFYIVNAEFGSGSTFSTIIMDDGVITLGSRGYVMANQVRADRIDLEIPDQAFEQSLLNNGTERVCAQRDYINEWIYFTFPSDTITYVYPNQTLQYNYRDNSWAVFYENYTTYGTLRQSSQFTWATVGNFYPTWQEWNEPWNAGASDSLQPKVIGGNQQGFVLLRDEGTTEQQSLYIQGLSTPATITGATNATQAVITANNNFFVSQQVMISGVVGMTQLNGNIYSITAANSTSFTIDVNSTGFGTYISGGTATPLETVYSPNHCLNTGDYIIINNALGTIGPYVNGNIYQVVQAVQNGFSTNPVIPAGSGTYLGNGTITRMYIYDILSKQFPASWSMGRKTRIGTQQYLFTRTNKPASESTLYIYLSTDADNPYNYGPVIPARNVENNALVYSTVLYTSPELYIQNCNNISLGTIGNSIATAFNFNYFSKFDILSSSLVPGSVFIQVGNDATFQDNGNGGFTVTGTGVSAGSSITYITGMITIVLSVAPTSQPTTTNFQYYVNNIQSPTAGSQSQIWHRLNTSLLGDTVQVGFTLSDAQMRDPTFQSQFAEFELHGFIMDISPNSLLA